jgi:hypothetical protein
MTHTTTINEIQDNEVYKQVLADSFGGIMYDVANIGKYNATELIGLWNSLNESEQESAGGIMKGVFNFLKEQA